MKKILLFLLLSIWSLTLSSQAPEGFSYLAIVRDNAGIPVASQPVSFQFSIIKGNPIGSVVYGERHNIVTDQFGGVSLIVGNGTDKTGDFIAIDWGGDAYFIKVELDITGGTFYSDMGTTQLLSVPYALHAKTSADAFSGNYNDLTNKPITNGSETKITPGVNITLTGIGTISNPYIINSETKIIPGINVTVSGAGTIANPYIINSKSHVVAGTNIIVTGTGTSGDPYIIKERVHYIGESYGGGIVFYVSDNGRHGLIAATNDQDLAVEWSNGTDRYTNTTGNGVNAGEMNTSLIIALQTNDNPVGNFAAKVCADYSVTVNGENFGDWYLPTKLELTYLHMNKDIVGGFSNNYYWSSTEFSSVTAWAQNMADGSFYNLKKSTPYAVRAIRAF